MSDYFTSKDGLKLFQRSWPIENAKANIYIIHGYFEHSGRYDFLAKKFNEQGYGVQAFDLRCHGKSEGERVYIDDFTALTRDVDQWMQLVVDDNKPFFLFAHSFGGLIASAYLIDHKPQFRNIRGLLMTGPALMVSKDLAPMLQKVAGIIGRFLPRLQTVGVDGDYVSRLPEVVQAYKDDPLNYHGKTMARTGWTIMKKMKDVQAKAHSLSLPIGIMHGTMDKLCELEGSKLFVERVASKDKSLKIYEGVYHELFREPEKEEVIAYMLEWFEKRVR
jgi:alpha-beta hydrolase superfamily lysophospholipase